MPKSNKAFDFSYLLLICKQYRGADSVLYANGEEELFEDVAEFKFSYDVRSLSYLFYRAGFLKEKTNREQKQQKKNTVLKSKIVANHKRAARIKPLPRISRSRCPKVTRTLRSPESGRKATRNLNKFVR